MPLNPVSFRGGVDLMTPATSVAPGTLKDCLNYERGVREGYTRMDGFRRVDGVTVGELGDVADYRVVRIRSTVIAPPPPGYFSASSIYSGEPFRNDLTIHRIVPDSYAGSAAIITQSTTDGVTTRDLIVNPGAYLTLGAHKLRGGYTIAGETNTLIFVTYAMFIEVEEITLSASTGSALDVAWALEKYVARRNSSVESIPGRAGSDIIGAFWLKNRLHAVRDLERLDFTDGLYTDANEGQVVTIGASEYEILAVTQTGGGGGFLTLDPVAGSGANATGISAPVTLAITGTPPDCDVGVDYNESGSGFTFGIDNETGAVTWSIVDDVLVTSSLIDADNPGLVSQQTNAALWKADDDGWTRVDTGREMLFSDGTPQLVNFNRTATLDGVTPVSSGAKFPTAGTLNGASDTGMNSDNGTLAALSGASGDVFVASGFDFSDIPSSAIIRGIEVIVERRSDTANQARDNTVTLVNLPGGTSNKARGGAWPNAIATATYGGDSDLWGNASISVSDLQDSDFGVMVIADRLVPATAAVGGIDYITVTVHYIERDTVAYVWDGATDQEITIRHVAVLGGDTADSTAYGYLTITCPQNADKTRIIDVGDEIRTAAAGAGDLLAVVAARDVPIWFPGQEDIDNNASAYKAEVSNFYASDQLDAAYIVCGVGPAVCFDGARTIRIRTNLPAQDDNPRHVARHGEKLALGFYSGTLALSLASDPLDFRSSEGAVYVPVGDRIMGLRGRADDELLIPCESSLQFFTGYTETTGLRRVITRNRGMLEYTDADIGIVLGCDGLGIFDIRTAYNFGPADRNYLSAKVAPWLQPRLQATDNAGQAQIRPIAALNVRAKNQYRLYFLDGYVLTMTVTDLGVEPTIQRYVDPSQNNQPLAVRALCSGIDSAGRERIFASFRNAKEGFMFELDSGRSFDGDAIDAFLLLNPIPHTQNVPSANGRADRVFVYGTGYGYANLTVSRAANYGTPDPDNSLAMLMGDTAASATTIAQPFRGSMDFPIEGYDVTWRFDSSTATEGPHTLQFTNLLTDDRGLSRGHKG